MGSIDNGETTADMSVALTATDLKSVPGLSTEIGSLGTSVADGDNQARLALLQKARALVNALETPRETMIKHTWAEVSFASRQMLPLTLRHGFLVGTPS